MRETKTKSFIEEDAQERNDLPFELLALSFHKISYAFLPKSASLHFLSSANPHYTYVPFHNPFNVELFTLIEHKLQGQEQWRLDDRHQHVDIDCKAVLVECSTTNHEPFQLRYQGPTPSKDMASNRHGRMIKPQGNKTHPRCSKSNPNKTKRYKTNGTY